VKPIYRTSTVVQIIKHCNIKKVEPYMKIIADSVCIYVLLHIAYISNEIAIAVIIIIPKNTNLFIFSAQK